MHGIRHIQQRGSHELKQQGGKRPQHGIESLRAGVRHQTKGQVIPLVREILQNRDVEAAVLPVDIARVDLDELVDERARGQLAYQRLVALPDADAISLVSVDRYAGDRLASATDLLQDLQGRIAIVGVAEIDALMRCIVLLRVGGGVVLVRSTAGVIVVAVAVAAVLSNRLSRLILAGRLFVARLAIRAR